MLHQMKQIRFHFLCAVLFLSIGSCFPLETTYRVPLHEEGRVIVYLQPLPQEASNLRFIIDAISAIRSDGSHVPLSPLFNEIKGGELKGFQKLLATGVLTPGSYTGLSLMINKAFVQGEEGEVALFVSEEPITAGHPFEVRRRQASTLFLSLEASGAVTDSIRFTPAFSLAGPGGILLNLTGYVSNSASDLISVFDKKTMLVVDSIATGSGPKGIVLDQRGRRAYVALSGADAVEVYDLVTGSFISSIKLNFGDHPSELAITPDGRTLVSTNYGSNTVSIIDAIAMFQLQRVRVGQGPVSVVVDPSGFKAYVMNSLSSTVSVVDLTQRTVTVTIAVEGSPLRGAFNRSGNRLFVISENSPNLQVIDPSQFRVIEKIFIGMGAASITVSLRTDLILVGKKYDGEITIVDPLSSMFIDTIRLSGTAAFMTIDRQENTLFVAMPDRRKLLKINLTSKKTMAEIEVREGACAVVVVGER